MIAAAGLNVYALVQIGDSGLYETKQLSMHISACVLNFFTFFSYGLDGVCSDHSGVSLPKWDLQNRV